MTARRLLDDCFLHDRERLSHAETVRIVTGRLARVAAVEPTGLEHAAGRYLAADIVAPRDVPLHDNAAVDGYAFSGADASEGDRELAVVERIAAGDLDPRALAPGEAARIFTGAIVPAGADTVAMQEDCTPSPDGRAVKVPTGLKKGANRRRAGEDVKEGETVLSAGQRLRPQDVATLASLGIGTVETCTPVRIALISTGNEIVAPGDDELVPGRVFDSNRSMLAALCATLPTAVTDIGILPDDAATIGKAVAEAARTHDVIIATGGASRGEEDHIVATIDRLGKRHVWQIAVKPGRPMSFGQIGDCVFLGLPGNPVAAFVCFLLYARAAITVLGGGRYGEPQRFPLPAGFSIARKKPDRREFLRGWLETGDDGGVVVRKFARDGSGLISGLRQATGLIEIPEQTTSVAEGDTVAFLPFAGFGIQA